MKIKSGNGVWKNVALGILVVCALFTSLISYRFYEFYSKSNRFQYDDSMNRIIDVKYDRVYRYISFSSNDGVKDYKLVIDHGKEVVDKRKFTLLDIWKYKP